MKSSATVALVQLKTLFYKLETPFPNLPHFTVILEWIIGHLNNIHATNKAHAHSVVENKTMCTAAGEAPDLGVTQAVTGPTVGWNSAVL